jgi:hypothetical protein
VFPGYCKVACKVHVGLVKVDYLLLQHWVLDVRDEEKENPVSSPQCVNFGLFAERVKADMPHVVRLLVLLLLAEEIPSSVKFCYGLETICWDPYAIVRQGIPGVALLAYSDASWDFRFAERFLAVVQAVSEVSPSIPVVHPLGVPEEADLTGLYPQLCKF